MPISRKPETLAQRNARDTHAVNAMGHLCSAVITRDLSLLPPADPSMLQVHDPRTVDPPASRHPLHAQHFGSTPTMEDLLITSATPVHSALVATHMMSQPAMPSYAGMATVTTIAGAMTKADSSTPRERSCAPTGSSPRDVTAPLMTRVMNVLDVVKPTMEPKNVLIRRMHKPLSPLSPIAWNDALTHTNLLHKYPRLTHSLTHGFDAGIPHIHSTYLPPNNLPTPEHILAFHEVVANEFAKGRYIGPFTRSALEAIIGYFQTSPISMIPKAGKPGRFRLVQNLSYPHIPRGSLVSINHTINSDLYPSTWGTFSTICTTIWSLPPGSQGAVRDIAEAYRSIPIASDQWPGFIIRIDEDCFAADTNACFGCSSSPGNFGQVGDAGADIFRAYGIGPVSKWVDDHIFFRIPHTFRKQYNQLREKNSHHIAQNGGM
jgi:hypothetical protein